MKKLILLSFIASCNLVFAWTECEKDQVCNDENIILQGGNPSADPWWKDFSTFDGGIVGFSGGSSSRTCWLGQNKQYDSINSFLGRQGWAYTYQARNCPVHLARDLAVEMPGLGGAWPSTSSLAKINQLCHYAYRFDNEENSTLNPSPIKNVRFCQYTFSRETDYDTATIAKEGLDANSYPALLDKNVYGVFKYSVDYPDPSTHKFGKITTTLTPCSRFGEPNTCRPIYFNGDANYPSTQTQGNYLDWFTEVNQGDHRGSLLTVKITSSRNNWVFPFEVEKGYILIDSTKNEWQELDHPKSHFTEEPPFELNSADKRADRGAYLTMLKSGEDINYRAWMPLPFEITDNCKEDMIYMLSSKITEYGSGSNKWKEANLYYIGSEGVRPNRVNEELVYRSDKYWAECKGTDILPAGSPEVQNYLLAWNSKCPDYGDYKCKKMCERTWSKTYLPQYHTFAATLFLDTDHPFRWYIRVPGNPKGRVCKKVKAFQHFSTVNNASGDTATVAKISNVAHPGVLTRLNGDNVGLRFELPQDPNLKAVVIDAGNNEVNMGQGYGYVINKIARSSDNADHKAYWNLMKDFKEVNPQMFDVSTITSVDSSIRRTVTLQFKNVKTTDFQAQKFKMHFIYGNNTNAYLEDVEHDPITVRARYINLDDMNIDVYKLNNEVIKFKQNKVGVDTLNDPSAVAVPSMLSDGHYEFNEGQYIVNLNNPSASKYVFADDVSGSIAKDGSGAKLNATAAFMLIPLDLSYSLKDNTMQRYFASIGKNASLYCDTGYRLPTKANDIDANGKIACSAASVAKININPNSYENYNNVEINIDEFGRSNALLLGVDKYRIRADYVFKKLSSTNKDKFNAIAYENNSDIVVNKTLEAINGKTKAPEARLNAALTAVVCRGNLGDGTYNCSNTPSSVSSLVASPAELNRAFYYVLNKLCADSKCAKLSNTDVNFVYPNPSLPLQKNLLSSKESRNVEVIDTNNPAAAIEIKRMSVNKYSEQYTDHRIGLQASYKTDLLQPKEPEFFTNVYAQDGASIAMPVPVIKPFIRIKDQKAAKGAKSFALTVAIKGAGNANYNTDVNYLDENSHLKSLQITKADCAASSDPICYSFKASGQTYAATALLGPDKIKLVSTYNNKIDYSNGTYTFFNGNSKTYTKDVIKCFGQDLLCEDFSVEFSK